MCTKRLLSQAPAECQCRPQTKSDTRWIPLSRLEMWYNLAIYDTERIKPVLCLLVYVNGFSMGSLFFQKILKVIFFYKLLQYYESNCCELLKYIVHGHYEHTNLEQLLIVILSLGINCVTNISVLCSDYSLSQNTDTK